MIVTTKINLCKTLLDELAIIRYLDSEPGKLKALEFVCNDLKAFANDNDEIVVKAYLGMVEDMEGEPVRSISRIIERITESIENILDYMISMNC